MNVEFVESVRLGEMLAWLTDVVAEWRAAMDKNTRYNEHMRAIFVPLGLYRCCASFIRPLGYRLIPIFDIFEMIFAQPYSPTVYRVICATTHVRRQWTKGSILVDLRQHWYIDICHCITECSSHISGYNR